MLFKLVTMAARTSTEVIDAVVASDTSGVTGSYPEESPTDVENKEGLERSASRQTFNQYIGVTKIESLCKLVM